MTKDEYTTALARLHLNHTSAAEYLRVHRVTSTRWGSGARAVPDTIELLLNLTGALSLPPREAAALAQAWGRGNSKKPVQPAPSKATPAPPRRTGSRG